MYIFSYWHTTVSSSQNNVAHRTSLCQYDSYFEWNLSHFSDHSHSYFSHIISNNPEYMQFTLCYVVDVVSRSFFWGGGPVLHFCPLDALQPVWLKPEVYCTIVAVETATSGQDRGFTTLCTENVLWRLTFILAAHSLAWLSPIMRPLCSYFYGVVYYNLPLKYIIYIFRLTQQSTLI
jgi:hypothetical protein